QRHSRRRGRSGRRQLRRPRHRRPPRGGGQRHHHHRSGGGGVHRVKGTPLSLPARACYLSRVAAFASLQLPAPLARAVEVLGFTEMTPVQEHALPPLLAAKDVIAQARAGSGKTVAIGLALLSRIDVAADRVQALVLCPTRELADQVSTEL